MAGCFLASLGGTGDTLSVGLLCFHASVAYVSFSVIQVTLCGFYLVFVTSNWSTQLLFVRGQFCHAEHSYALVFEASSLCKNIFLFS